MQATLIPMPRGGALLLDRCPGRDRPAPEAVAAHAQRGISCLVSLVEEHEFPDQAGLEAALAAAGIAWIRWPIRDFGIPDAQAGWAALAAGLHARLDRGETVGLHCWGGLGRSGMVAARLAAERGMAPAAAVHLVRSHRPGTVETAAQAAWVAGAAG